ncbi:MAG: aminotransferase class V-fold PLP-dependent enzyme [Clostridia bacterium]|nr:aminotransferase class V-fold PLP-dependent enzyme [Clostridia bacterium]
MIYLDNAATAYPKPAFVIRETLRILHAPIGNPGRSGHLLSRRSALAVFRARESLARLLNMNAPERIVFTSGATAALNIAILGSVRAIGRKKERPLVVTDVFEHNSVLRPLFLLQRENKIRLEILSPDSNGALPEERILSLAPDLFIVTARSNVTGHEFALFTLFSLLKEKGCIIITDASQALGSQDCSFQKSGAHMLCASGHKGLMGIMGGGLLAFSHDCPLLPEAVFSGGSGSDSFNPQMPDTLPDRLEAGTLPLPAIVSMGAGAEFIMKLGLSQIREQEREIKRILTEGIRNLHHFEVLEPQYPDGPILIRKGDHASEQIASQLEKNGILTRGGFHCAPLAHRYLGTEKTGGVRLSPGIFTTKKEAQKTLSLLHRMDQ